MCAWTIGRTRRVIYVNVLLWICILYGVLSAKAHKRSGTLGRNDTSFVRQDGFTQKKPRSAQYGGFIPRIQTVYPRQRAPVRLATIPINAGYRLPITQRLANVAPLTSLPGIPRTYVPVISTVPSIRYPLLRQSGLTGQYVVPYTLKMPAPNLPAAAPQVNEDLGKHYNEKYNTLPAASEIDLAQDGLNMPRKTETKKVDIGDEFDNFLESLDGPCSKHPCKNGAKCRMSHDGTSFHCICKRGYRGKTCEEKNECFPNPCENNGECTLTSEGFECSCSKRFKGKKCEQINTCEPNPCQHDGVCTELTNGGFECTCKKGHFGDKCQVSKQGCSPNPCRNDGQCREKDNGGFECICPQGYTGENCDRPNNKCFNNPCKNGGSCMQAMTSTGYECACARGFRGTNCEDHSGCDVASCQNGGTCYETEFGVRCICRNGYSGDKCQIRKFCEADTCQNNGKCIEHVRGFRCVCPEGYKGKMCDEIDNCRPNPCQHGGHCEQSESGYFCKCTAQYHGRNCEVSNPCARNPCKNGGKCTSDFDGQQYQCQCPEGFRGTNCEERNLCAPNPCENDGVCRSVGSEFGSEFSCECRNGFGGKTCAEKDPCLNNPCVNEGVCSRVGNNDFTCSCPDDYKGVRCEVKRHCRPNPCLNDGVCQESGDDFVCSCKEGFRGQRCEEQDQCVPNPCKNDGRCVSVGLNGNRRAFVCECANSFFGDTCEERNPCHPNPCGNQGQCTEINGGFTCQCKAGYKGDRCREIDKCNPNPCQHQGSCTEIIGGMGYACKCAYGYKGKDCEQKDYCHPNPCEHEGQCSLVDNESGYQCKCAPGYMGLRCSESNPCEPNPCLHDSHCILFPGFGKNHECNCTIGWSGDTCEKREICRPNPCQFGTKCIETGDDSYSCVKSMCHPNPCQNSGKCINVNENNFQCACNDDYEGKTCEGDDMTTDFEQTTKDKSNRASIERHTTTDDEHATTNIDKLLRLVDTTLDIYKSKHHQTKTVKNNKKVTNLLKTLKNGITNKLTNEQQTPQRLNDDKKPPKQYLMNEQNTKQQNHITDKKTNENVQQTDDNSDIMRLNDDLIKSLNPDGEVVVENSNTEHKNAMTQHAETNTNVNVDEPETNDITKLDNDLIKSLNPEGQVVVDNSRQTTPRPELTDNELNTKLENDLTKHVATEQSAHDNADSTKLNEDLINLQNSQKYTPAFSNFENAGDDELQNDLMLNVQAKLNATDMGDSLVEGIPEEDAVIKSINPAGGVVVDGGVPRKHSQLSLVPSPPQSPYPQRLPTVPAGTAPSLQLVKSSPQAATQLDASNMKSDKPPSIPMSSIASCSPFLCQNEGVCIQEAGRPIRCRCPPMYTGETCAVDKCHDNPCKNDGVCLPVKRQPGFVCKCKDGLTGPLCDSRPCEPNPCKNNGKCVMFYSVYLCKCKTGFRGKLCEETNDGRVVAGTEAPKKLEPAQSMILKTSQAVSPCSPSPCKNSAQCLETSDGEYECICTRDFSGPRCEEKGQFKYSSAPKFFPGRNEECEHCDRNARCVNGHCICKNKYVGDGLECWERTEKDDNWNCQVNPCKNGGTCKEGRSGCVCRLGFSGDYCEEYSPPVVHLTFDRLEDGERVRDMSGNGNDGLINQGFQITPGAGKCDNAGNLNGGDIIFDGENFRGIPRKAITIAVWVKLSTALGIQSIFDTVGSHSRHKDGQYHFEIDNGRVRWFHRNEDGKTVFSAVTDDIVVREGNWNLITGTYSVDRNRARIYVNGDMKKETNGKKMSLSGDWGFKAGIGKHEHPYGARVLRGMVDEFSIFPSELSRLQILVLKTHCKVYYNKYVKKPSTQSKESYSEIKANSLPSYNQQAMPYPGQQYQPQASYNQAPSVSSNYPNYQSGSNQKGYYGNYGYQPATTGGQTGYQRSQGYKRPSLSKGPTSSPTYAPRVLEPPSYVPKSPSYVPQRPANAQGTARWGIPERAYQIPNVPSSTVRYPYTPTYKASDGYTGYPKSYTPQGLAVKQAYNPQWSAKRQDQFGYPRTQTPGSPVSYRGSTNTPQYQPSVRSYNGYRVTQAGRMSQLPQNTQNMVYPQGSREAYNSMPSRQTNSDTQSNRYVPMNVPKYNTNQYARNIPNGQYQIVSPTSGQQRVQYGQQDNQYSGGTKSFIAQSPSWQTDVPKQMTSSGDVTSMTYANDMPQAQTAYTRNNVYANAENYGANTQNNPASYAAATRSITPQYGPNYAYSAGLSFDQNSVRGNIPRPTSSTPKSYVTKKPQNQQNLRTLKGQNIGPSESKKKLSRINTLDEHGQYPSDVKRYKPFSQLNGRKLGPAQGNAQSNRWSARSRTPWASVRATKMGSGTGGIQGGKPEGTWNSGTFAKSYTQLGWPRQRFRISPIYARVQPRRQQARTQDPYRRQNVHGTAQNLAMVDPNVYKRIEIASRQSKVNFRFPRKDKAT
ncbi:uncharacterized protein LOC114528425 isoform X2 [Dendronephthya gigantea]|uniref:uncharacterized protein LOC114528425 isoform X2 n=1 Tax=Dendronephthya gigantea TaxID=151771 RepID=UPI0010695FC2|nr:uncharacterized protein LOC114528425 isoform X2 [Dendronephthya gigantea]